MLNNGTQTVLAGSSSTKGKLPNPSGSILFCWENLNSTHLDRIQALDQLAASRVVIAQIFEKSTTYPQEFSNIGDAKVHTLISGSLKMLPLSIGIPIALAYIVLKQSIAHVFLCHYNLPGIFLASILLRLCGVKVYTMNDSKFDDLPRSLDREMLKWVLYAPYHGAICAGRRSADYLRFLGFRRRPIEYGYDTVDIKRLQGASYREDVVSFDSRNFLVVARLVSKKNLVHVMRAYAQYSSAQALKRPLIICGTGPDQPILEEEAAKQGISSLVHFVGWRPSSEVAQLISHSLCVLLISTEEQFGFSALEASILRIPVIYSVVCGSADEYLRSCINGYMVEPDNQSGLIYFMSELSSSERRWENMRQGPTPRSGSSSEFATGVLRLCGLSV